MTFSGMRLPKSFKMPNYKCIYDRRSSPMEWLSPDFQGLHFDTQAINETSSSWGLIRRNLHLYCLISKSHLFQGDLEKYIWRPQGYLSDPKISSETAAKQQPKQNCDEIAKLKKFSKKRGKTQAFTIFFNGESRFTGMNDQPESRCATYVKLLFSEHF